MKLFVGLGNPGAKYARNRHNVGFMVLDRIAERHNFGPWRKRFKGLTADGLIGGEKVLLLKPQTYYNDAGRAVSEAARFLKIKIGDIIVFQDEIDLAPGKLRTKTGGGAAGNNGLRSITSHLSADFVRVRIGIGHPGKASGQKDLVANYVLSDIPKADWSWLEVMLDEISDAAPRLASGENERFQTDVSQGLRPSSGGSGERGPRDRRNCSANRPRGGTARSGGAGKGGSGKPEKRGSPSQLELAAKAANSLPRSARPKPAPKRVDPPSKPEKPSTALADRLKRWLTGKDNNDQDGNNS